MADYSHYKFEDFLLDDSFFKWVSAGASNDSHWATWTKDFPESKDEFLQAVEVIKNIRVNHVRTLTNEEIDEMTKKNIDRNRQTLVMRTSWLSIAASLLVVLSLGWVGYTFLLKRTVTSTAEHRTAVVDGKSAFINVTNGKKVPILIRLDDGTSVILNPASQLRYPRVFKNDKREVFLDGVAFFEVTKNAKLPFYVYSDEMVTRVLGTSFLIRASHLDRQFKVIVNTGKVAVSSKYSTSSSKSISSQKQVLITPNQEVTLYRDSKELVKNKLKKPQPLSLEVANLSFNFHETPISKVVDVFREAYGVNIRYNEKNLANCPLTASLSGMPLYEKLDLICKAIEANYRVIDGEIIIDGNGCSK